MDRNEDTADKIKELENQISNLEAEYEKLMKKKSLSLMTGDLVVQSGKSIKGIISLPFKLLKLRKQYLNGEIRPSTGVDFIDIYKNNKETLISKNTILFMATNGVGLGHLTRCLAVARRMKNRINPKQIIFLTTSPALHLIRNEGFIPFYVPSKEMFSERISSSQWDNLLLSAFYDIFYLYNVDTIIFDGAIPYQSLLAVLGGNNDILKIWMRRGSAKKSTQVLRQKNEEIFDLIIIPMEAGDEIKSSQGKYVMVEPILYLDNTEQLSKDEVRMIFGVNKNQKLIYVQLGAGKINNMEMVLDKTVKILLEDERNIVVIGKSPLGDELNIIDDRVIIIKDYPNAKYFKGFDLAVSACGYNSFHELLYSQVYTIFIPNLNTGTDDQLSRAKRSELYGTGIVLDNPSEKSLREKIKFLINKNTCEEVDEDRQLLSHGAAQAADIILKLWEEKQ